MKAREQTAGLEPMQITELQDAKKRGASIDGLAERFGISRRSVYRYLRGRVVRTYLLDGWSAFFFYDGERTPVRLTPWER